MHKTIKAAALILAVSFVAGCAKAPPRAAARAEGRRTRAAASLEKRVRELARATSTIKALAWMRIDSGSRDWRTDAAIVIDRPDRVRVDAMDALADVWAKAGSDGTTMWLYLPAKKKLYEGKATSRNIRRLASFELAPDDLISMMAGSPPLCEAEQVLELAGGGRRYLFPASGLECEARRGRVSRCVKPAAGGEGIVYQVEFGDYRKAGKVHFPHSIDALFPGMGASLAIRYSEVQFGNDVSPDTFQPPRRRGIRTHRYRR